MGSLENKKVVVSEITEKMKEAKSFIVTDYRGLNVAHVTKLRAELRSAGVEYKVLKNTL
jgi:large subunit ribosomal protein L10